jgi:hypothetical protein
MYVAKLRTAVRGSLIDIFMHHGIGYSLKDTILSMGYYTPPYGYIGPQSSLALASQDHTQEKCWKLSVKLPHSYSDQY